jgi:co-chaperonin GroES (HSP10)
MIQPIRNWVLIKIIHEDVKTRAGIYLPENRNHKSFGWGKVLNVGNKVHQARIGDKVYLNRACLKREVEPDVFLIEEDALLCREAS